jgi:hypothetical protein
MYSSSCFLLSGSIGWDNSTHMCLHTVPPVPSFLALGRGIVQNMCWCTKHFLFSFWLNVLHRTLGWLGCAIVYPGYAPLSGHREKILLSQQKKPRKQNQASFPPHFLLLFPMWIYWFTASCDWSSFSGDKKLRSHATGIKLKQQANKIQILRYLFIMLVSRSSWKRKIFKSFIRR